ncbi:SANT/Myb domain-containing protein [Bradyrhizobium uaiense]|uniref:SANT/Myb domain-containing protein n=1 Tax=Bradyrhizobium uaiense TaxID=2594946 RepID=A0A6P1BU22_9BRAD|nr:SANT/Myb domain-containing protein [Bradyrhizobium uaiense]NEV01694.1 SANT/Myb domain-containing protein [Bradyrhizobium uaiense]
MPKPWTAEEEQRLLELRNSGLIWIRVAGILGRTEASVVGHYLKHLKKRPRKIICEPELRLPSQDPLLNGHQRS